MNMSDELLARSTELTNRFNTGAAATMVEIAMNNGAQLQVNSLESSGHIPMTEPKPVDIYRALMTTNGVSISGPSLDLPEQGIGISLDMVLPGYASTETATHFDLTVGSTKVTLPTDGTEMTRDRMKQLLAAADVTHPYDDDAITGALHVAGSIGLAPANVLSATEWFLHNQSYLDAAT